MEPVQMLLLMAIKRWLLRSYFDPCHTNLCHTNLAGQTPLIPNRYQDGFIIQLKVKRALMYSFSC